MATKSKRKVLLIGWDAADWKVILPLVQAGKMPAIKSIMDQGVWGKISTLDPPLSPMLWTSIATGFRADKHGILGFIEPNPDLSGVRPVTSTSRKVKAIWNILNQEGYKSNVIAWWPSNPVEPINGCMVSNFFQVASKPQNEEWPLNPGTIYPESMIEKLKECRVHPSELTPYHIYPFIPKFNEIERGEKHHEKRISAMTKIIAEASTVHATSTLLEREEWDFMAVYHDMIDHMSHMAMKFHPPKLKALPEDLFEIYKDVVNGAYIFQDMMLERSLQLCDEDTTIMILSDHGFHSDHLRPVQLPKEPAAPAREHSPYGIFCLKGPGIKKGERVFGASVLDITPTLLHLYGLPVGKDMEGKILMQCFEDQTAPKFIDSWETIPGETGQHSSENAEDPWASKEAMEQLVQLGYVEPPEAKLEDTLERISNESQYYLARNLINANKQKEAIPILETIFEKSDAPRFGQRLAYCYLATRNFEGCRKTIDKIREILAHNKETNKFVNETSEDERKKWLDPDLEMPYYIDLVEGLLYTATHQTKKAVEKLKELTKKSHNSAEIFFFLGRAYMMNQKWQDAADAFITCLAIDDENARAYHSLGTAFLRMGKYEDSIEQILNSIELNYQNPIAHYHLGEALAKNENYHEASQAFEVAIKMQPGMSKAYKWLIHLYRDKLNKSDLADKYSNFMKNQIKGEITIVSGLPRSGTSMMMQILEAGGMDILSDKLRNPDENNPKGYYEFDPVKRLASDKTWLPQAQGKVVKIIAQLVSHLPSDYDYKIIMMERDIDEVLISQQKMLGKLNQVNAKVFPTGINETFKKQLQKLDSWIESQPNVQVIKVNYSDVINNPEETALRIASFVGEELSIDKMLGAVDKELYRNRLKQV